MSEALSIVSWLLVASMVVLGVAAIFAWLYVRKVYAQRQHESRELRRLVMRDKRVAMAGAVIALLVSYSLARAAMSSLPAIPTPWTAITIALAVDALLWGVVADARAFRAYRIQGQTNDTTEDAP